jgi:hypothetical protein
MGDSHSSKPGSRPGASAPSAKAPAGGEKSPAPTAGSAGKSGRIVHDERGNAIWDWVKDTARIAIDSTSRLLRRLEVPELKMEDTHNEELRIESDRDAGGGYDPYGGSTSGRTAGAANTGGARSGGAGVTRGSAPSGADRGVGPRGGGPHGAAPTGGAGYDPYGKAGGSGYDPYGKGVTRKPTRKP